MLDDNFELRTGLTWKFIQSIKRAFRTNMFIRGVRENLIRLRPSQSPIANLVFRLNENQIHFVIDVGANVGQFGLDLRRHGYQGEIISFEPIPGIAQRLRLTASRNQPWKVVECGLGSRNEIREINVSGNSALSSSFLEMLPRHIADFPNSETNEVASVQVKTLDAIVSELGIDVCRSLIKMDVQGFEMEVIKGGASAFSRAKFCYFEASLIPLYKGEANALTLLNALSDLGQELIDMNRGISSPDNELLQVDFLTHLKIEKPNVSPIKD